MMNNQNTSDAWSWTCRCGRTHPLRRRECSRCGEGIPQSVRTAVYKAELSFQKDLYRGITFKRSVRRMEKLNKVLSGTMALLIIIAVLLTGYVYYDCSDMIGQVDITQRFDIAILHLETAWEKVTAVDLDVAELTSKFRLVPDLLTDIGEKFSTAPDWGTDARERFTVVQNRLKKLCEKMVPMPDRIWNAVAESANQMEYLSGHVQERMAAAVEYVQVLLNRIQEIRSEK